MTYRSALGYLYGLQAFGVKLGLQNIRALLTALGSPERAYPSLLVTGSNGKGSVVAMAAAALAARGLKVGLYTSPHLVRLEERIVIDGTPISARRLAALVSEVKACIETMRSAGTLVQQPTFFEVVTALALLEFARQRVDVAALEVGLGGRFDATNAVDPVVSAVTNVALEHTRYLGDHVTDIAFEKAGIARPGRPLVVGTTGGAAHRVLAARALAIGAELVVARRRYRVEALAHSRRGLTLAVGCEGAPYPRLHLPLPGRHQTRNVAVALAALAALPPSCRPTPAQVARGFARTRWPGRLEYRPGRPRLLLDGAHNPHAAAILGDYLAELEAETRTVLLFSCLADKDLRGVVAPLARRAAAVVVARVDNPRSLSTADLRAAFPARLGAEEEANVARALARARARAGSRGLVVVCGSLYLVGAVRALLDGSTLQPSET